MLVAARVTPPSFSMLAFLEEEATQAQVCGRKVASQSFDPRLLFWLCLDRPQLKALSRYGEGGR